MQLPISVMNPAPEVPARRIILPLAPFLFVFHDDAAHMVENRYLVHSLAPKLRAVIQANLGIRHRLCYLCGVTYERLMEPCDGYHKSDEMLVARRA